MGGRSAASARRGDAAGIRATIATPVETSFHEESVGATRVRAGRTEVKEQRGHLKVFGVIMEQPPVDASGTEESWRSLLRIDKTHLINGFPFDGNRIAHTNLSIFIIIATFIRRRVLLDKF